MAIIANSEAPAEYPPEAHEKAEQMRGILNADREESEIARMVAEFDGGDVDMQLMTWELLTTRERSAWRTYFGRRHDFR